MSSDTLQNDIEQSIHSLFGLANELTWNKLSTNCKFILTEIKVDENNFHELGLVKKIENEKKQPVTLQEIMPTLQKLYDNLYDINLYIYKATKDMTVIEIRYYPKSSFDKDILRAVINNPPMLHCKVSIPSWLSDEKERFDINWEHNKSSD